MRHIKTMILTMLVALMTLPAFAFEYEGINYDIVDSEAKTCAVGSNRWVLGDVVIQPVVYYDDIAYSVVSVNYGAFSNCSRLTTITLPEGLTTIEDYAFSDCSGLTTLTLPEGLATIGYSAFSNCSGLTTLTLPSGLTTIGDGVFSGCSALTTLTLPSGLTTIGNYAFYDCSGLTTLTLPSGLTTIGKRAFYMCSGLTTLTLPEGVTTIGELAFRGCSNLTLIDYGATQPIAASEDVFSETAYANATLNMPNATLADIQATTPWNLFGRIVANDGSIGTSLNAGDEFEYEGIIYTVIDPEARTCKTKDGMDSAPGNRYEGALVIPQTASDGIDNYTVTGIGHYGFTGCGYLNSVTLPATIDEIGVEAFAECPRLTSLVWNAGHRLAADVTDAIANPNLLVYVVGEQYAPEGMTDNVVVMDTISGIAECRRLVLTTGYPFGAVRTFDALYSTMTKEFTQTTPLGGCAGWETIVLPFDATRVAVDDARGTLTPFALITDILNQYPYWLCEADSEGEWKDAFGISAGVPYLIAMPNNPEYASRYRINGPVTFSNPGRITITPGTTAPYCVTWASGHEFRSLWQPLDAEEAANAMGLNVGIDNLTNDEGETLAPGSAFHVDVVPLPFEAYVMRQGTRRALPVKGGSAHLAMVASDDGLTVTVEHGTVYISGSADRRIDIFRVDGACFGSYDLKAGELLKVEGLAKGVYIIGGKKVIFY